ncbi:MAG TPA: LuxR C-terminal-related transcriptional regulator [Mycobacteriales bacterium]|nr:LuxR C-terminal-related transcriptional regulator [Mycobacteriales bacterium]
MRLDTGPFREALAAADLFVAEEQARALLADGLPLVDLYDVVVEVLDDIGDRWARGRLRVADEHLATAAAEMLVARLRGAPTAAHLGTVLLVTLEGERHVFGLHVLAHLLEQRHFRAVVAGELPPEEIGALAGRSQDLLAVGIGMHDPPARGALTAPLRLIRAAAPRVRILLGGRAFRDATARGGRHGADAVCDGARAALALLEEWASPLSPREREVLRAVAEGLTNAEAGAALGISAETVKAHMDAVFAKLGVSTRASAVALGLRRGWLR